MPSIVRCGLIGAAIFAAIPALAQQQPQQADSSSEIVVTGNRTTGEEIREFVGALTAAPRRQQLSRFEESVCPLAVGLLAPTQRAEVTQRMRRVAEAAGIRTGGDRCDPNVLVIVTHDKRAFIEALREHDSSYFLDLSSREVRRIIEQPGPASAWQLAGVPLSADGVPLDESEDTPVNRTVDPPSRITAGARPQFAAAVVVIEARALVGLTTTQLADYAAMRAFAQTDPSQLARSNAPTILNILEAPMGSAVPITLTEWDLGFLRGVYQAPANLYASSQRAAIRRGVRRELEDRERARSQ